LKRRGGKRRRRKKQRKKRKNRKPEVSPLILATQSRIPSRKGNSNRNLRPSPGERKLR